MSTKYTYGQGWPVDSGIDPVTYERPYPIGDDYAVVPDPHESGVVAVFGAEDSKELEGGPSLKPKFVAIPTGHLDTGIKGQEASGGSYHYKCTATDTWVRLAIETVF